VLCDANQQNLQPSVARGFRVRGAVRGRARRLERTLTTVASPDVTLSGSTNVTLIDGAILSGGFNPTGTVTFLLTGPGGSTVDTETVTVNGNGTYTTPIGFTLPTIGTVVGTYSWAVTYSGDPNNNPAADQGTFAEQTVVFPASPRLGTGASSGGLGSTLTDSALLLGGYFPKGTITFLLTGPAARPLTPRQSL
jgi:hypothetical protein